MDGQTLDQIRSLLLERWTRHENSAKAEIETGIEEEPNSSAEIIDIAQSLEQLGRDTSLREAERRELVAVEKALAKMSTGSFGVCEDCAEEIPPKRLMIVPEARLCAQCQAFAERQGMRKRTIGAVAR